MSPLPMSTHTLLVSAFSLALSSAGFADTIRLVDGTVIDDVTIENEGLLEVTYEEGRDEKTVASERVLEVEYSRMPTEVDEAMGFLSEGDVAGAVANLRSYVAEKIEKKDEKRRWAPAFAAYKLVELYRQMADHSNAVSAARQVIDNFPDSRYVPAAYLAKAEAELQADRAADAAKTLTGLSELVATRGLPRRWDLECKLAQIVVDPAMAPDEKRKELALIVTQAGDEYPNVRSRARVAEGETFLAEAEATGDQAAAKASREKAREVFEAIVSDTTADDATLAGAHAGLGDCLFYLGADAGDNDVLQQACLEYLRVITVYPEESQYVPKSLFYAMRCFDLMEDRSRKNDMKRELLAYPDSRWAKQAESF